MNIRILAIAAMALGLVACGSMGSPYRNSNPGYDSYDSYGGNSRCHDCGVVQRIDSYQSDGRTSGGGAVAGALIGGVLGNQVGGGDGRRIATVVGAVAGGVAGNTIERNSTQTNYTIDVRMDNGQLISVRQHRLDGVREGSRVVLRNGSVQLR